jgi:hypothetical protein
MTLTSEVLVEVDGWKIKKLFTDGAFTHYALNHELENGHSTNPFDEVRASGGLLSLYYNGEKSVTFTGVISGSNTYNEGESDMPQEVFEQLKEIGPY